MMTYRLLIQLGHRFAAGASAAGPLTDYPATGSNLIRPFPVLHIHGTGDAIVLYNGGNINRPNLWSAEETLNYWIENNSCTSEPDTLYLPDLDTEDNSTVEKISYLNCADETSILFYKVIDGGHHWPGGDTWWTGGGNLNMDINASVEVWNFFKNYENPLVNMAYSKSLEVYPFYIQSQNDTLTVRARLSNPENHPVNIYAIIHGDQSAFIDTLQLFDDGLHGDGDTSDNMWGNIKLLSGLPEDEYKVDLVSHDLNLGTAQYYHLPARFISLGPVKYTGYTTPTDFFCNKIIPVPGGCLNLKITLKNNSSVATATNIKAELTSLDSLVSFPTTNIYNFENIAAGETSESENKNLLRISEECPDYEEIPIEVNISSYDHECWCDTFSILVQGPTGTEEIRESTTKIYPNPAENMLNIEISNTGKQGVEIEILTVTGELIYRKEYKSINAHFVEQIDLSNYTNGIYLVKARQEQNVRIEKLIVY